MDENWKDRIKKVNQSFSELSWAQTANGLRAVYRGNDPAFMGVTFFVNPSDFNKGKWWACVQGKDRERTVIREDLDSAEDGKRIVQQLLDDK